MGENEVMDSVSETIDTEAPLTEAEKCDTPTDIEPENEAEEKESIDYEALVSEDMRILSEELGDGETIRITDLKNPTRYGALRDLGLTPKEAYLASGGRISRSDNRSHLNSSVPKNMTVAFAEIPRAHLDMARDLFSELSDSEIKALYRKVTQ